MSDVESEEEHFRPAKKTLSKVSKKTLPSSKKAVRDLVQRKFGKSPLYFRFNLLVIFCLSSFSSEKNQTKEGSECLYVLCSSHTAKVTGKGIFKLQHLLI